MKKNHMKMPMPFYQMRIAMVAVCRNSVIRVDREIHTVGNHPISERLEHQIEQISIEFIIEQLTRLMSADQGNFEQHLLKLFFARKSRNLAEKSPMSRRHKYLERIIFIFFVLTLILCEPIT